ncbi:pyruvate dehydrogenase E2 component (dihydrolipoamide acetyltransferase) [Marinospirillum celere]|uniref:Acetyltransferase component of pyruvate dehydrogenase complex n=1 Tax=Marinospirillum celere TaxID=1122252 RepID=A0A1I1GY84_9GAMM|nr:dihydrolipoyllysine-residue acetyltransferase [Marinospirillum celere]SFC16242.1 pyruvate dehydrogenase E2 component (dihydrolipoamide acetyltransferase) [Marinospirillum celere]
MSNEIIKVPDIGGNEEVEVIELNVQPGDRVEEEDTLIVLESDKASMDIPSPKSGVVKKLLVKEGDKVKEGSDILELEVEGSSGGTEEDKAAPAEEKAPEPEAEKAAASKQEETAQPAAKASSKEEIRVPDLGGHDQVEIIEVAVKAGDSLNEEDPLITLETDKATMDVPSPFTGKLLELLVKEGDKVSEGDLIGYMQAEGAGQAAEPTAAAASTEKAADKPAEKPAPQAAAPASAPAASQPSAIADKPAKSVHAGPAVRMLGRELGVDLAQVKGSGPKGRILKEDLHAYVKQVMQQAQQGGGAAAASGGAGIPPVPVQDFSQFGEIEEKPMGRLLKAGAVNLHRSWLNVPHVTQFDQADITELESFRKSVKAEAEKQGAKLTPLPFIIKACALALQTYPQFNVSLGASGDTLIWKKYINIGFAVDTPDGLLVAVVKDVDKKSIYDLARETADLGARAQKKQLKGDDMKGSCFTISSLGSIGGTAFTPIVNAPEVAILGVSKASMQPVWDGSKFEPRLMLPLSLSYDHRAINGADAARFTSFLSQQLGDIRKMLL